MADENAQSISNSLAGINAKLGVMKDAIEAVESSTDKTAEAVSKPPKPNNEEKFERQKQNERLVDSIQNMTKELSDRIGVLKGAFKDLQGGNIFTKLGTVIQVGFAVAAAYAYRVFKVIEPVIEGAKALFGKLAPIFKPLIEKVTTLFNKVAAPITKLFSKLSGPGGKIIGIIQKVTALFKPLFSIFKPVLGIVSKLGKFLKAVPLLGQIITIVEGVYGAFKGFFATEGGLVDKIFGAISGAIAQILQGLTFGLLDFDTTFEFLTGFFNTVREFFATYIPPIWESLKESFVAIWNGIYDFFAMIIPPIWEGMKQAFSMFLTGIGYYFDYVLMPVWGGVKSVMTSFWEALKDTWEYLSPIVDSVLGGIGSMFGKMYDFFVEEVPGMFISLIRGVIGIVKGIIGTINDKIGYFGLAIPTDFLDSADRGLAAYQSTSAPKIEGASNTGSGVVAESRALADGRSRMTLGGAPSTNLAVAPVTNVQNNTFTKQPIRSSPAYNYELGPKF
jgi:phage-related protein